MTTKIFIFPSTQVWTVPPDWNNANNSYLVVAGGGGGAGSGSGTFPGGGGGGGGVLAGTNVTLTPGASVTMTVGAGGTAGAAGATTPGGNGVNSSFGSVATATGGGGGAAYNAGATAGSAGGCGGGGAYAGIGGVGSQGNNGGASSATASAYGSGGGGGGGGVGAAGTSTVGGNGGIGALAAITGASLYYAGGGGGGCIAGTAGTGGTGGGGNAGAAAAYNPGVAGGANTGGGGGGGSSAALAGSALGGAGGSGIIIVSYTVADGLADPNTLLLCHCDGTNGSTTFTDSSFNGLTITATGNDVVSTTNPKFGTGCLSPGTIAALDSLSVSAPAMFEFGTGNFTMECWFNANGTAAGGNQYLMGAGTSNTNSTINWGINRAVTTGVISVFIMNGSTEYGIINSLAGYTDSAWHHLAYQRNGSTFTLFIDGVSQGTATSALAMNTNAASLLIGNIYPNSVTTLVWPGYIDEVRVSNIARYTQGNFTPPTTQFGSVGTTTIFIMGAGAFNWTVPSNWNSGNNEIFVVGAGGNGGNSLAISQAGSGGAGGGGAFASISNLPLAKGATVSTQVGVGGGTTTTTAASFLNGTTLAGSSVGAPGGVSGANATAGYPTGEGVSGAGGAAASCVGTTKFSGGAGGANPNGAVNPGGGGSAGPIGAGQAGGAASATWNDGQGGGGANGGASTIGGQASSSTLASGEGVGGNGTSGTGGAAAGSAPGAAGTKGGGGAGGQASAGSLALGTGGAGGNDTCFGSGVGVGGGGGAGSYNGGNGGAGGSIGGGGGGSGSGATYLCSGGVGGNGIIVISYMPSAAPIGTPQSLGTAAVLGGTPSSFTITTTAATLAGDLLVCAGMLYSTTARTVASISDGTNVYQKAVANSTTGGVGAADWDGELWFCNNAAAVASGATLTITFSGALAGAGGQGYAFAAARIPGVSGLDKIASQAGGGTGAYGVTTAALGQPYEIAIGAMCAENYPTSTPGFTLIAETISGAGDEAIYLCYEVVNAITAVTLTPTYATNLALGNVTLLATFYGTGVSAGGFVFFNFPMMGL